MNQLKIRWRRLRLTISAEDVIEIEATRTAALHGLANEGNVLDSKLDHLHSGSMRIADGDEPFFSA
jgi:hypothetical protein